MDYFINIGIIVICVLGLWGGATIIVESASRIARKLGLSELVIGLTIVAIATSAPEFAVTVSAAIKNQYSISVGNVIGSNIFNLGIILGLVAIFGGLKTTPKLVYRDGMILLSTGILLLIFFRDLKLEFYEGAILFSLLVIYVVYLVRSKQEVDEEVPTGEYNWKDIPKLIIGAVIIIASSHFFVEAASYLARLWGISEWLIGITIVAAGTSAPELATSIVAVAKGRHGLSVGNLIGSDIFNMLGVLGLAAMLRTLGIQKDEYNSIIYMVFTLFILLFLMRSRWKLTKRDGILILFIGFLRWFLDFYHVNLF
jgi:cation:H+ antiporter